MKTGDEKQTDRQYSRYRGGGMGGGGRARI